MLKRCAVLALIAVVTAAGGAGGMYLFQQEAARRELESLRESLLRLTRQERRAEFRVLAQEGAGDELRTTIRFVEIDGRGRTAGEPRDFTIRGNELHIDALIVKFDDDLVIRGDAERGHPLLLFHRAFGKHQAPAEGFPLDRLDEVPGGYRTDRPLAEWERRLWADFWKAAQDPERYGVRAAHGNGNYIQVQAGRRYVISLRASGELTTMPAGDP